MTYTFRRPLVLVVGAGASYEVDLPVGEGLKQHIADALFTRAERGSRSVCVDACIDEAIERIAFSKSRDQANKDRAEMRRACKMIHSSMPLAASIDNFIDAHRGDAHIALCGKLGIAQCILKAESKSKLWVDQRHGDKQIDFKSLEKTWFNKFFRLLIENCQAQEIGKRLSQVAIICFNYDRCIEHFLFSALQEYYRLSPDKTAEALSHLRIYHPYGFIGPLPWKIVPEAIAYGASPSAEQLMAISAQLKTFTEGTDVNQSEIMEIRSTLRDAKRIVFLGFAYNHQNLQLLYSDIPQQIVLGRTEVFGTAFGISQSNIKVIRDQLQKMGGNDDSMVQLRNDLKCSALMDEYGLSLSFVR